jgi:hypothetical protein
VQLWRGPVENYRLAFFFMQLNKSEMCIRIVHLPFPICEMRLVSERVSLLLAPHALEVQSHLGY